MTQAVRIGGALGPLYASPAAVGYRVDENDGTPLIAFTTSGITESGVPGTWFVDGTVTVPDEGAVAYLGTSGNDGIAVLIEPAIDAILTTAHGSGAWTTADVSGLATSAEIAALPTAAEIDTQLTGTHGAGSWVKAIAEFVDACCRRTWSVWDSGR